MPALMRTEKRFSGAKLKAARRAAGWSLEELSITVGRTYNTIVAYECGYQVLPLTVALAFAYVFDIDAEDLEADPEELEEEQPRRNGHNQPQPRRNQRGRR
jgi:transcriptional regulator with XRE-family HTH domain